MTEVASLPVIAMPSHSIAEETAASVQNNAAGSKAVLPWQTVVAAKRAQLETAIPDAWRIDAALLDTVDFSLESTQSLDGDNSPILRDCKILSDHELAITEKYNAGELLAKLAAGELTALEVTLAFSKRAAVAQQLVSLCFSPFCFLLVFFSFSFFLCFPLFVMLSFCLFFSTPHLLHR